MKKRHPFLVLSEKPKHKQDFNMKFEEQRTIVIPVLMQKVLKLTKLTGPYAKFQFHL